MHNMKIMSVKMFRFYSLMTINPTSFVLMIVYHALKYICLTQFEMSLILMPPKSCCSGVAAKGKFVSGWYLILQPYACLCLWIATTPHAHVHSEVQKASVLELDAWEWCLCLIMLIYADVHKDVHQMNGTWKCE